MKYFLSLWFLAFYMVNIIGVMDIIQLLHVSLIKLLEETRISMSIRSKVKWYIRESKVRLIALIPDSILINEWKAQDFTTNTPNVLFRG